jgi:hypothetical protein
VVEVLRVVALAQLHQPQVANMAAEAADWAVVLQQTMVALVYLEQAVAVEDNRELMQAHMVETGVTMSPQAAHSEGMEGQEQLLEPQGRVESLAVEAAEVAVVLGMEELLAAQEGQEVRQAVAVAEVVDEVMAEVVTAVQEELELEAR